MTGKKDYGKGRINFFDSRLVKIRDKIIGMILGVAIGDALGVAAETKTCDEIAKQFGRITGYVLPKGHKWYDAFEPGRWTDDTQLTLAILESITECGGMDMDDIARRHVLAMDECSIDWGKSTKNSIAKIKEGVHWSKTGNLQGAGNGVAMKIAGLAAYHLYLMRDPASYIFNDNNKAGSGAEIIRRARYSISMMTHRTDMGFLSAVIQQSALLYCLRENGKKFRTGNFMETLTWYAENEEGYIGGDAEIGKLRDDICWRLRCLSRIPFSRLKKLPVDRIVSNFGGGTCYVYNSLPFSLAMFMRGPRSIETLYDTVNAGGDTDSNGSMVAALLGAYNGTKIFPKHLVEGLWQKERVITAAEKFCDRFGF